MLGACVFFVGCCSWKYTDHEDDKCSHDDDDGDDVKYVYDDEDDDKDDLEIPILE